MHMLMVKGYAIDPEVTFCQITDLVDVATDTPSLPIQMKPTRSYQGYKGPVYCVIAGISAGTFITGGGDGRIVRWRTSGTDDGELIVTLKQAVFSLHILPKHNLLMIGTEGGNLHVVNLVSNEEVKLFTVHQKGIFCFETSEDGWLVAGGGDGTISIWDPSTLTLVRQIPIAEGKIRDLKLSQHGSLLALASTDGTVRILDTDLFNERFTLQAHRQGANCVAWHPIKPVLLSGGRDGHIRAWHTEESFRQVLSLPAHEQTIYRMAFGEQGILASASRDKSVKLWDAGTMEVHEKLDHSSQGHTRSVNDLTWLADSLVTVNDDGIVRLFHP
jgi:WD40 repeat protein